MSPPLKSDIRAITIASLLTAACAASSSELNHDQGRNRELEAFGQAHPQCQLWTNWQQTCSRTGIDGGTVCVEDAAYPVTPSEPFCVADVASGDGAADLSRMTPVLRNSLLRYCERTHAVPAREGRAREFCSSFKIDRPFNGRSLSARLHPWCNAWSDAATHRTVCSNNQGISGVPQCLGLARVRYVHDGGLYCSIRAIPQWCEGARGFGTAPAARAPDQLVVATGDRDEIHAVRGVYCRRRG
jgi:hypothetical protein